MNEHHKRYNWKKVAREHPHATDRRAGVVLIHDGTVLIVTHKPCGGSRANRGVPKGGAAPADKTALDTALRELREETGIDVRVPRLSACISGGAVVVEGPNRPDEFHVYFIIEVAVKPDVRLCLNELIGYEWVPVDNLRLLNPVSMATTLLFTALSHVDMKSKCQSAVVPILQVEGA